jgi:hypothetical protein
MLVADERIHYAASLSMREARLSEQLHSHICSSRDNLDLVELASDTCTCMEWALAAGVALTALACGLLHAALPASSVSMCVTSTFAE